MMDKIKVKNIFTAVFEKSVLDPLLTVLDPKEVKFWGTEGTMEYVKVKGYSAKSVITGFDFDGRVKTVDRKVFAAVLADKSKKSHLLELKKLWNYSSSEVEKNFGSSPQGRTIDSGKMEPFDLVVVDLYKPDSENFPESVDIGGQALIRAAIKNYKNVALAFDAESIKELANHLKANQGQTLLAFRKAQAQKAAKFIAERTELEAKIFEGGEK